MTEVMQEQADATGTVLGQLMGDFAATAGVVMTALGRWLGLWDALAAGPAAGSQFPAGFRCRSNHAWVRWSASSRCARSTGTWPSRG
jgi:hypothetical protein